MERPQARADGAVFAWRPGDFGPEGGSDLSVDRPQKRMTRAARRVGHLVIAGGGIAVITYLAYWVIPLSANTVGFLYLLFILLVASSWGFTEAVVTSLLAAAAYDFFFISPIGSFRITGLENWVAMVAFIATAMIGGRLSGRMKRRATEAVERQQELERLYAFSRSILLIDPGEPFPKQLARRLAEIFEFDSVLLYDRRTEEFFHGGPLEFGGMQWQCHESALRGTTFTDPGGKWIITAVRLGGDPIASLGLQGRPIRDPVLQGIANLVAIGLERERAHELAREIETTRQTERLRSALLDAMAHEFKTPLTSIKAVVSSLLAGRNAWEGGVRERLRIADEEADRLRELIDDVIEMARLETADVDIYPEPADLGQLVRNLVASMRSVLCERSVEVRGEGEAPRVMIDAKLMKLAIKQLVDNALKYSPPGSPIELALRRKEETVELEISDCGPGVPEAEQKQIFQRFYRGSAARGTPGSGMGLSIARKIIQAHQGDLQMSSYPGKTTFRVTLPVNPREAGTWVGGGF